MVAAVAAAVAAASGVIGAIGAIGASRPIGAGLVAALVMGLAASAPAGAAAADAERGRRLAERYHCGACHVIPEVPAARGRTAVSLAGFGRRSYIAGRPPNEPRLLERWLVDPAALVPGTAMPAMGVSAETRPSSASRRETKARSLSR